MTPKEAQVKLEEAWDRITNAKIMLDTIHHTDAATELSKAMDAIHSVIKYCDERRDGGN